MGLLLIKDDKGDVVVTRPDGQERPFLADDVVPKLKRWAAQYDVASAANDRDMLEEIGRDMFGWLDDGRGWLQPWTTEPGSDTELEVRVPGVNKDALPAALLDAPWEILADADGHLARPKPMRGAAKRFVVWRRVGNPVEPLKPNFRDLRMLFMAAAPEGQLELDIDREEQLILKATYEQGELNLLIEETGTLEWLGRRWRANPSIEILHLSCHGEISMDAGPGLLFETMDGGVDRVDPGRLVDAFGGKPPELIVLSACRTAEHALIDDVGRQGGTAELSGAFAPSLAEMAANVVGWDGPVSDSEATSFSEEFYGALVKTSTVPRAAAQARERLLDPDGTDATERWAHWHLARVYLGPKGGGPLCAQGQDLGPNWPPIERWLDEDRKKVRVAPYGTFVGRRRTIQQSLSEIRRSDSTGVLLHGLGELGKSSVAHRLVSRTRPEFQPVVIYFPTDYAPISVFDRVAQKLLPKSQDEMKREWRDKIILDQGALKHALQALIHHKDLQRTPVLLIIDDLQAILDIPAPGQAKAGSSRHWPVLSAILRAFGESRATKSRLLITSRYDFQVKDESGDAAATLTRIHLGPMRERDRTKQLQALMFNKGRPFPDPNPDVMDLLKRALKAAGGNPGVLHELIELILAGGHEPAERKRAQAALNEVEAFLKTGELPKTVPIFARLSLNVPLAALSKDELKQFQVATLFGCNRPIPQAALAAAGQSLGLGEAQSCAAIERIIGLGLFDTWGPIDGQPHHSLNAFARPLATKESINSRELRRAAQQALAVLQSAWQHEDGCRHAYREEVLAELARIAADEA